MNTEQIVTPPLLSKAYCQLKHVHYAQIDEDSTKENFCAVICCSYKPPPMIIYCAYCLQRAQDLFKHRFYCYHDVRHRFFYVFYLYEEGSEVQDEAQQTIICCQGPYKLKMWRYGQVCERFPLVSQVLRGAMEEIFYNLQTNDPLPEKCKKLKDWIAFTGDKNKDLFMVWCLYFKKYESVLPPYAIPTNLPTNTPFYDDRSYSRKDAPPRIQLSWDMVDF